MSRSVYSMVVVAGAAVLLAAPAAAQVVRGSVIDNTTFMGVVGAGVTALDSAGKPVATVLTDSSGAFVLRVPAPGPFRLRTSALGYRRAAGIRVEPAVGGEVRVVLRIVPDPVAIDSITVMAQGRVPYLARAGFYRREAMGWGRFLDEKAIEAKAPFQFSDLLHGVSGMQVVCGIDPTEPRLCDVGSRRGATSLLRTCTPTIVLDGFVLRTAGGGLIADDLLNPADLQAVEVYPGPAGVPMQWTGPCGAIIAWSKR